MEMEMYIGYHKELGSKEGACLIFAHTIEEAKQIAFDTINNWFDLNYTELKVKMLKNAKFLMKEADQIKLKNGVAHVVECPATCEICDLWGRPLDSTGICSICKENIG